MSRTTVTCPICASTNTPSPKEGADRMTADHLAEARALVAVADHESDIPRMAALTALAQAHATIAQAEQQLTANLIAFSATQHDERRRGSTDLQDDIRARLKIDREAR